MKAPFTVGADQKQPRMNSTRVMEGVMIGVIAGAFSGLIAALVTSYVMIARLDERVQSIYRTLDAVESELRYLRRRDIGMMLAPYDVGPAFPEMTPYHPEPSPETPVVEPRYFIGNKEIAIRRRT